jgi:methylase of polypeptide subunit release factors
MNYSAINLQGNILTSDILEKIRTDEIRYQKPGDFKLSSGATVRDEINLAWNLAISNWNAFKARRERLSETDSGTVETRKYWMMPLLQILGYEEVVAANAEIIQGKTYAISHRAKGRDNFPIHIVGVQQSLDKKADSGGTRLSPHALVQEYLNNHEHLYALLSNGRFIRILRDATRLSRLSYLEFDLEQIMEQGLYAEFALMYRVIHATRMPANHELSSECILEFYHQEALASGTRIRERLSKAVKTSIHELANGLLKHPGNAVLRDEIESTKLKADQYYLYTLRLVYRILFLMVIEERKLIYPEKRDETLNRLRDIYYQHYSMQRLAGLAEKLQYVDPRKTDLWQSLLTCFSLFEQERYGKNLGIAPLGSGIFAPHALGLMAELQLDNQTFLGVVRKLVTFENNQGQLVRVNYADLDVEEFGSVYEGLLEFEPYFTESVGQYGFDFKPGTGRSESGSHYTPEELVQPLLKHSLDYLIQDKLKEADPEKGLLSLTICDAACGSGHILLSAARRVGFELARVRSKEDQPTPPVLRAAIRDVIRHCIYGVDLNPLAIELCKVALWLESHNPGEPLGFLDHHIKCGNAIVGLAHRSELENGIPDEAFKTMPGDEKEVAAAFRKRNSLERKERKAKEIQARAEFERQTVASIQEAIAEHQAFSRLPETSPEEVARKAKAYEKFIAGKGYTFLRAIADTQVAQFFIPKTSANKDALMTDGDYRRILSGYQGWQDRKLAKATAVSQKQHFFHWFLEFPEVMGKQGFDCVLGNPPFLGGQKLSGAYGDAFLESIKYQFAPIGAVDLVTYFFRRIFTIIRPGGFQSLISTNTIAQGSAREVGLVLILNTGGSINHAVKGMKWPGLAAVEVSLITIYKGNWKGLYRLNGKESGNISAYLDESSDFGRPFELFLNSNKSYQGSIILGKGFVLESNEATVIISEYPKNKDVIFPYLNGDDLNNNPGQQPSRYVINFFDWSEEKAMEYQVAYNILSDRVRPERQRWKTDSNGRPIEGEYALRSPLPQRWWQHGEKRPALYRELKQFNRVLVSCRVSKYVNQSFVHVGPIFDVATSVVLRDQYWEYAFLQSSIHDHWAWKYASTLESRIRYINVDCIDTFPIPEISPDSVKKQLDNIGESYHEHRRQLMLGMQLGLTKTYNLFHSQGIQADKVNMQDKQVALLIKHLEKTPGTVSLNEAIQGILKLRELHVQMDEAVLEAYGWRFDSDQRPDIQLRHDFYEVDYLPDGDRNRYTIHPDARKEVLKRLLELNHKIHAEEVKSGLWDKKKAGKKDKGNGEVREPESGYGGLL